ncbi:NPCBM/NEW2 domain-containing protein [Paenibacillus sp. YN15]|uniref:NPCBM/NEW2 domain-containing protein n=1 Tax=Paenibacillus sp. YN15 TaxID=1742774 RepID=UPI0015EC70FB|nr:NPCBM/NEW2 domain-containing protein [Paenibacillus sp. YN15]
MKERLKGFIMGASICSLLFGSIAYAAEETQIQVFFKKLTYIFDGVEIESANEPGFIYNGTTYVPIRFVSEALGKKVEWDGDNDTIWIGKKVGNFDYLTDLTYARADGSAKDKAFFDNVLHIAGSPYMNKGIKVKLPQSDTQSDQYGSIDYNLEGKYSTLTGKIGIDDTTKNSDASGSFKIIGDGKELFTVENLRGGDQSKEVEVNITGVSKLQLVFSRDDKDSLTVDFVDVKLIQ